MLALASTAVACLLVPALAYAAPQAAVSVRARTTVTHHELVENTAKRLATPVGIATASGEACELRCVVTESSTQADTLSCELGDVRSIDTGFEVTATWTESGVTLTPTEPLEVGGCD